jgi:hypothetical protein
LTRSYRIRAALRLSIILKLMSTRRSAAYSTIGTFTNPNDM